jgi:uncharacterized protein (DUF2141 family)
MIIAFAAAGVLAATPAPELHVRIERLRNDRGDLHLCLTRNEAHFPDCAGDPGAVKHTVPASAASEAIRVPGLTKGTWSLSVFHDENRNRRLDTMLGIPREGFGFSRNPAIRFGPPRFAQVSFDIGPGVSFQTVRMQYLLYSRWKGFHAPRFRRRWRRSGMREAMA